MSFLSPQRISITQIRENSKKNEVNSPNKLPQKEQNLLFVPLIESNQVSPRKIVKKVSNESYRESLVSQNESDHSKKTRIILKEYLEDMVQNSKPIMSESESAKLALSMKNLSEIPSLSSYLEEYFKIYNYYHAATLKSQQNQPLILPLRYKQAKNVILIDQALVSESKSGKNKKILEITMKNEQLKKEVFKWRQTVKELQKRLLFLIEEFKKRKATYLKEIEKLTNIVQTSIKGIPQLITFNKIQAKGVKAASDHQLLSVDQEMNLVRRESDYNTIFYDYNKQLNVEVEKSSIPAHQKLFLQTPNPSSLQRYKSESKIRIRE